MQAKIMIFSVGFTIKNSGFGVNLFSGATIAFRHTPKADSHLRLGISGAPNIGSKSGTTFIGHVDTVWFNISAKNSKWLANRHKLGGQTGEIMVTGAVIGISKVDIKFNLIDSDNNVVNVFTKADVKTANWAQGQISSCSARGKVSTLFRGNSDIMV